MHELIESHGYIAETHHIWTEDDYRLDVHRVLPPDDRIPSVSLEAHTVDWTAVIDYDKNHNSSIPPESCDRVSEAPGIVASSKVPVLVFHGLLSSSADWVLLGSHNALAYILCDNGYDVWLGNARGNSYSRGHKRYSVNDSEFWNFSWHEIGYYDIPALIDYILDKTGHEKLYYIGYSQGTTVFYVMGSERPEYNDKVKSMISLAPIAYIGNQKSPLLKCLVYFLPLLEWGSVVCNINHCFPRNKWWQTRILSSFVRTAPRAMTRGFCYCWFHLIAGFGSNQLDKSMLPAIFGHFPAGASTKQVLHFAQLINSKSFQKYDHGAKLNKTLYGSTVPPEYNLSKVKTPVTIFYSENDFLTHTTDVLKLARKLPNIIQVKKIKYEKFNHIDYLWGRDAKALLYTKIVKVLKKL
ncbi:PREDICTED: lipase 3-like isoform X2 [Dinoponera quadriceps]|uniref:Lipase n=1 Tax=Dinoponera quadriceps TaxID=609295 RepID=A0A6P3Y8N4_DINQU|nr:PREDICTED: lipase 3-like isoform X2 [Dinoponera quadriceps]